MLVLPHQPLEGARVHQAPGFCNLVVRPGVSLDEMRIALVVFLVLAPLGSARGEQDKGAPAPDFSAKNQEGKDVKLADFKGKKSVLLAFYPKDFTGG